MSEKKINNIMEKINVRLVGWIAGLLLIIAAVALPVIIKNCMVYQHCYVEAGVEVKPEEFLKNPSREARFGENGDVIDVSTPGEYHVTVQSGIFSFQCSLIVTDTIAPTGKSQSVSLTKGKECEAEAFVSDIVDATQVEVVYKENPDFSKTGKQKVEIILKDLGENETIIESELLVAPVVFDLDVEAGSKPPVAEDFIIGIEEAEILTDMEKIDYTKLTVEKVRLRVDGTIYETNMHIVDTVAPVVEVHNMEGYTLATYQAEDFITSMEEVTETDVKFVKEPDKDKEGEQLLDICVTDAGGNETIKSVKLVLKKDTEPPVIYGVKDMVTYIDSSLSYKSGIEVADNCRQGVTLNVDNSAVNLNQEGTYPVQYIAKDLAGNETIVTVNVTVKEKSYSEEELYALADKVLAKILKDGMSLEEKARAIYKYVKGNIGYISHSDKGSWIKAAYEGLVDKQGDCYVYACTAKALLTRAGIKNMDIEKIPAKTRHYWSLVDLGNGWYHFDCTPRKGGGEFFMLTDAELMNYSNSHNLSHNYDHSLYPAVN